MKTFYETPEMEVIAFASEDIISTSGDVIYTTGDISDKVQPGDSFDGGSIF